MLTLKYLPIKSFNENVAYLHRQCPLYDLDGIRALTKVEIHGGSMPICACLNIVDDQRMVKSNEIALNYEAFKALGLPDGANVSVIFPEAPQSLAYIKKKIQGNTLSLPEYQTIIHDMKTHRYTNVEAMSFVTACNAFMTAPEVVYMVQALSEERNLYWDQEDIVVDCCSLGEIPGDSSDVLITAIVAAYGLPIPKIIATELSAPYSAAHIMNVFAQTDKSALELQKVMKECRGAIVAREILSCHDVLTMFEQIKDILGDEDDKLLVARLLASKMSAGVTHLVVDIPVGGKSQVKTAQQAVRLRKLIEYAGDALGLEVDTVITDGREPIGAGIGALLGARDVMRVLRNKEDAPQGLKEKALFLAGRILEFDPNLRGGQGYNAAKEILNSGRALETFNQIVTVQGKLRQADLGGLVYEVRAASGGKVLAIDNEKIGKIGLMSGMAHYQGAGLYLLKKVGDKVVKGEILYLIYAHDANDFALAKSLADVDNGYGIGR